MLWYNEKELFSIYTGSETPFGQDYQTGAKQLYNERIMFREDTAMEARDLFSSDVMHPKVAALFKGLNVLPKEKWEVGPVEVLKGTDMSIVELVYKGNTTIELAAGDSMDDIDPSQPWILLRGIRSKVTKTGTARESLTELMPLLDKHDVGIEVMNQPAPDSALMPMALMYESLGFNGDPSYLTRNANGSMEARRDLTQNLGPASFYPRVVKVLETIRQPKMKASDLKRFLQGKGVGKEELWATGLDEFLESKSKGDESVTIEEVQAAVQLVELEETRGNQYSDFIPEMWAGTAELSNGYDAYHAENEGEPDYLGEDYNPEDEAGWEPEYFDTGASGYGVFRNGRSWFDPIAGATEKYNEILINWIPSVENTQTVTVWKRNEPTTVEEKIVQAGLEVAYMLQEGRGEQVRTSVAQSVNWARISRVMDPAFETMQGGEDVVIDDFGDGQYVAEDTRKSRRVLPKLAAAQRNTAEMVETLELLSGLTADIGNILDIQAWRSHMLSIDKDNVLGGEQPHIDDLFGSGFNRGTYTEAEGRKNESRDFSPATVRRLNKKLKHFVMKAEASIRRQAARNKLANRVREDSAFAEALANYYGESSTWRADMLRRAARKLRTEQMEAQGLEPTWTNEGNVALDPSSQEIGTLGSELFQSLGSWETREDSAHFQPPHFPDAKNNLAWARTIQWTSVKGKAHDLFVIEIQSDWANAAVDAGFGTVGTLPPFVATPAGKVSDSYIGLIVKRLLAEAADTRAGGLVITTKDFANTTEGINYDGPMYDKASSMLKKIGKKLDPDATFTENVASHAKSPQGARLEITDKIRDAVAKGMPMFGNTTMEARRDIGIRVNETSSKLRITKNAAHEGLADIIDDLPIQDFFDAGKHKWFKGFWDEEVSPLVDDYVHSIENAYNEWYVDKLEQKPVKGEGPLAGLENVVESLQEDRKDEYLSSGVPDNVWREAAELFEEGPNRDATPVMTLLKLARKIRAMYVELAQGTDVAQMGELAAQAMTTMQIVEKLMFNQLGGLVRTTDSPSLVADYLRKRLDFLPEADVQYFEEVTERVEGQKDKRATLGTQAYVSRNHPMDAYDELEDNGSVEIAGPDGTGRVSAKAENYEVEWQGGTIKFEGDDPTDAVQHLVRLTGYTRPLQAPANQPAVNIEKDDIDVNPYAPMVAFEKAAGKDAQAQLWEDTLGYSYENRPKSMKVDLIKEYDPYLNLYGHYGYLVRHRKGGKNFGTILHVTPTGAFRNAETIEAATAVELRTLAEETVIAQLYPLSQEKATGKTTIEVLFADTALEARRLDGSKRMVSVTGVQPDKLVDLVGIGKVVMPSIATVDANRRLPFFEKWNFGDVFLVWDPDAVRPESGEPTYTGDAYSVRTPNLIERDGEKVYFESELDHLQGKENYVRALAHNILEFKHRQQAERGGIRGSEVDPKAMTGAAAGLVRSAVLDKVKTTEQMREELSKRQPKEQRTGELTDTFTRHQLLWAEVVEEAYENGDTKNINVMRIFVKGRKKTLEPTRGTVQARLYSAIQDFFVRNAKPDDTTFSEYLQRPEVVARFVDATTDVAGSEENAVSLLDLLRDMSTSPAAYFETKPQRMMPFGKGGVVGILVPSRYSSSTAYARIRKVLPQLKAMGVSVREYSTTSANEGFGKYHRVTTREQDSFVAQLDSLEDTVMYARKLPADRTSILNSPAMGMIMRDEFERRGFTAAEQTPFQAGFRAGGRATRKLQSVRDKEERKYAVESARQRAKAREARKLSQQRELLQRRIDRVKLKAADAESLRESAITIVKMLSKKDRGDLAIRLARVKTSADLTKLAIRAIELAAMSEYKSSVSRLRKLKSRLKKRKAGMTNEVKAEVAGKIASAEAMAHQSGTSKMFTSLDPADAVNRVNEIEKYLDEAVEIVNQSTIEHRASKEDRKGRLGNLAAGLIDALNLRKERPMHMHGKERNRKSSRWFRRSRTTLSMVELITQHAPAEVQQELAELLHYNLTDAESAHLTEVRGIVMELDKLAKEAGFKSFDSMMDIIGTTDIEAVTKTVTVSLGGESVVLTLDNLMKLAAMDSETIDMIVDEVDATGAVVKKGVGIQLGDGDLTSPVLGITRSEIASAINQLPMELRNFVRAAKSVREALRGPAFEAYFQIHGTEPVAVLGYEPRRRESTPQQAEQRLDIKSMTSGFIDDAGFTKGRAGGGQAVVLSGFVSDFLSSTEALSKLAHMAVPLRDAIAVIGQREVRDAINTYMGSEFALDLENRLMHGAGMLQRQETGFLGKVSGMLARAYLTLNVRTWARVLFGGAANLTIQMNPSDLIVGIVSLTNIKQNLQEAWTNGYLYSRSRSGAMRRQTQEGEQSIGRIADQDFLMASVVKMAKSLARSAQHFASGNIQNSFGPLKDVAKEIHRLPDSIHVMQAMDNIIAAIAYGAYKSKYQAEGLSGDALVEAAAKAAERIMRETQNTSSALDATVLDSNDAKAGTNTRAVFPFVSDPVTKANALYRAIKFGGAKEKAVATVGFATTIATNMGVTYGYAMLLKLIADLFADDEPEYYDEQMRSLMARAHEKQAKEQAVSGAIDDVLGNFGYLGIVASWGMSAMEGYDAGVPMLWASAAEDIDRQWKNIAREMSKDEPDEEKLDGYIDSVINALRMAAGDPTVSPSKHIEKIGALSDPTVEDVEKAVRALKRESPLAKLLGMTPEELSKAEKRAVARFKKTEERKEKRLATQPQ